jgi:hypothetical protein
VNQASVYQAFTAVELTEAVLHIRGKDDTPEERKKKIPNLRLGRFGRTEVIDSRVMRM